MKALFLALALVSLPVTAQTDPMAGFQEVVKATSERADKLLEICGRRVGCKHVAAKIKEFAAMAADVSLPLDHRVRALGVGLAFMEAAVAFVSDERNDRI